MLVLSDSRLGSFYLNFELFCSIERVENFWGKKRLHQFPLTPVSEKRNNLLAL